MQQPTSPAPLHGVTSASGTSYGYDAAGDRTNAGYASNLVSDSERRLVGWTNGATMGSAAYDGEGNRVAMRKMRKPRARSHGPIGGHEQGFGSRMV